MDHLTAKDRSLLMSRIRGKNTQPERIVLQVVRGLGFRFRTHVVDLPGTPDIVFRQLRKVIQVHGCFWHRHRCRRFRMPKSRVEYWNKRLASNALRDRRTRNALRKRGWDVLTVWECQTKDKQSLGTRILRFLNRDVQ